MNIYFAGSIRGAKAEKGLFRSLISHLSRHGKVLTEHSFDLPYSEEIQIDDREIYYRDITWLDEADLLVAEVTSPSLGVGYEIGRAESLGKPILCLYRWQEGKRLSAMINGNSGLAVVTYHELSEAFDAINEYIGRI
ncbi:MAG: nucleoside 2-deoxyribosyltransferase [Candidatus Bathyarchaeota archaeon]|jgi:nucleoside 2-deoxyribosyltransferase